MDLPLVLTVIGLVLLVVVVVLSIVYSGQESGRLRSASAAARYLESLARKPGWTRVSDEEDMPAGRMSALPGLGRRGTVAGVHERATWRRTPSAGSSPSSSRTSHLPWTSPTASRASPSPTWASPSRQKNWSPWRARRGDPREC